MTGHQFFLTGYSCAAAQVRLAKEARELAVVAMQKEPQDDLAQHLMGRQAAPAPCLSNASLCHHL